MQAPSARVNARNRCISINGKNPERNEMSKLEARSEVSGFVWKIEVASGQQVAKGDTLVLIESMKMEIPIIAEAQGVVVAITVEEGAAVNEGSTVAILEI
jgi:acetyl-CoA carboxylase biotin carboxyl carrier protein